LERDEGRNCAPVNGTAERSRAIFDRSLQRATDAHLGHNDSRQNHPQTRQRNGQKLRQDERYYRAATVTLRHSRNWALQSRASANSHLQIVATRLIASSPRGTGITVKPSWIPALR